MFESFDAFFFFVFIISCLGGSIIATTIMFEKFFDFDEENMCWVWKNRISPVEQSKEEIAYERKWFQEYDDLEENELTEDFVQDLKLNPIVDTTPTCDALMYYDNNLESFVYYAKTKEIPYKYLETLARKYVITYNCKKLYIDIRKEVEKGRKKAKEIMEKEKDENNSNKTEEKKNSVFANFKTYNRKGEVNSKGKDKIYVLKEASNRYSYRGKMEEYKEPKEEVEEEVKQEEKSIDYASFKKMKQC